MRFVSRTTEKAALIDASFSQLPDLVINSLVLKGTINRIPLPRQRSCRKLRKHSATGTPRLTLTKSLDKSFYYTAAVVAAAVSGVELSTSYFL